MAPLVWVATLLHGRGAKEDIRKLTGTTGGRGAHRIMTLTEFDITLGVLKKFVLNILLVINFNDDVH